MPLVSAEAARKAADDDRRSSRRLPAEAGVAGRWGARPADPKALFAKLINANPSEISYIPNTSTGENLVVNGLGMTKFDGNVVTDTLHFDGALVHLLELQKQGLDLRVVKPRDYRIDIKDLEKARRQERQSSSRSRSSRCTTATSTT